MTDTSKIDLIDLMPEDIAVRFRALKMQPSDWTELDKRFSKGQYHACIIAYQANERRRLPWCNSLFGLCQYWDRGFCTAKNPCARAQRKI